jgi:hypothetical protein
VTARRPARDRDRDSAPEPDERTEADQQLREIVDRWFPLTDAQKERLSLLLNPGRGRRGAA